MYLSITFEVNLAKYGQYLTLYFLSIIFNVNK